MKKSIVVVLSVLVILAFFTSACGSGKVTRSRLERNAEPAVPPSDAARLVDGNTAFAFDLYQALRIEPGNHVLSPYSISLAFAMPYAGARGDTASQMASTLHFKKRTGYS